MIVRRHYNHNTYEHSINVYVGDPISDRATWKLIRNISPYDFEFEAYAINLEKTKEGFVL